MKIANSNLVKVMLVGILITSVAAALQVNIPNQVKEVPQGEPAQYAIELFNDGSTQEDVKLSAESEMQVTFSDKEILMAPGESQTVYLFAMTQGKEKGTYFIKLKANDVMESLALNVNEGAPSLAIYNSYETITVPQRSSQKLKMVVRNTGTEEIENIVVKGDITEKLNPEYPDSFDLDAGEEKEVNVLVEVPDGYPTDEYTFEITAGSGSLKASREIDLNIVESSPLKGRLKLEAVKPWEKLLREGEAVGYEVTFRTTNKGLTDLEDVEFKVTGLPEDWNVSGTEAFDIEGGEIVEKDLKFDTKGDFSEETVKVELVKDGKEITSQEMDFQGSNIGVAGTGLAIGGLGSALFGLVVLVAAVFVVLYVRETNLNKGTTKAKTDTKKLKRLVDEALKEGEEEE